MYAGAGLYPPCCPAKRPNQTKLPHPVKPYHYFHKRRIQRVPHRGSHHLQCTHLCPERSEDLGCTVEQVRDCMRCIVGQDCTHCIAGQDCKGRERSGSRPQPGWSSEGSWDRLAGLFLRETARRAILQPRARSTLRRLLLPNKPTRSAKQRGFSSSLQVL